MTRKIYIQPAVSATRIAPTAIICTSNLQLGGSGNAGGARAPERSKVF